MSEALKLDGQLFGLLTVEGRAENDKRQRTRWICKCACGNRCTVSGAHLMSGHTSSCGCAGSRASIGFRAFKHGHDRVNSRSREYNSWAMMIVRCTDENREDYHRWGGRGITVCDRWRESFENFLADMGPRPPGRTLDRYPDKDGNYEPGNCRWATWKQQAENRRKRTTFPLRRGRRWVKK
jgi:hypothetical protein